MNGSIKGCMKSILIFPNHLHNFGSLRFFLAGSREVRWPCYSEFLHLNAIVEDLFQGKDLTEPKN